MDFTEAVTMVMNKAPKGWQQKLSLAEYDQLYDERKRYYGPLYAKYRTKKVRDYDDYGNFTGWWPTQVGVGKPIGYEYVGYIEARLLDQVLDSNVLTSRVLSDPKRWK